MVLWSLLAASTWAAVPGSAAKEKQNCSGASSEGTLPAECRVVTENVLQTKAFKLPYKATAGTLPVKLDEDGAECRIFYTSYQAEGESRTPRPLTFVFNGGPGASSAYLHLGALGPKRVVLREDGSMPGPPVEMTENPQTWLRFTDLVFVDPPGTGYSQCSPGGREKDQKKVDAQVWDVQEDLTALARFINLYLTRNNRWLSPRFLVGESYGGFRVAALSELLQTDYDISLNGIILVSPALEFELLLGNEFSLLPWVARLPSYAATARQQGKAAGGPVVGTNARQSLAEVERFAVREYLPALAAADTAPLQSRLASLLGLSEQRIAQLNARISPNVFVKELLQERGRMVSAYDGSIAVIDPDPSWPFAPAKDPLLVQFNSLLGSALNSYVRTQLHFETDIPYKIMNWKVSSHWNWRSGLDSSQGYAGVAENLKSSMSLDENLKVFIVHGVFDLVTPYFGSVLVIGQMQLDPAVASNLKLKVYDGGHMFYTNERARQRFFEDSELFFAAGSAEQSGPPL